MGERFTRYGWDKNALFYPTTPLEKLLVLLFLALVITHFSEILSISDSQHLIYGFLPLEFAYNLLHAIISIIFILLVYRKWPEETVSSE